MNTRILILGVLTLLLSTGIASAHSYGYWYDDTHPHYDTCTGSYTYGSYRGGCDDCRPRCQGRELIIITNANYPYGTSRIGYHPYRYTSTVSGSAYGYYRGNNYNSYDRYSYHGTWDPVLYRGSNPGYNRFY